MHTSKPPKDNQGVSHYAGDSDYKLMIQQEDKSNYQRFTQDNIKNDDWLSTQFNKPPFLLYKYWLILNFAVTLVLEFIVLRVCWNSYVHFEMGNQIFERMAVSLAIGFMFFLYGCCEIFFAMSRRNSRIAQQGVVKFQYSVIGSLANLIVIKPTFEAISQEDYSGFICVYGIFSAIIHLIGGLAVLRIFKRNHPLKRPGVLDDENSDFLQQNEVIGREIAKYDKQLNRWPFLVYGWWLKFVVVFEIWLMFNDILWDIILFFWPGGKYTPNDVAFLVESWLLSVLNAYSCYEAEIAIRTKSFGKSKRALFFVKIGSFLSFITCLFAILDINIGGSLTYDNMSQAERYLFWISSLVILPILTLIGAIKVNKILEQRDQFARVSNYTDNSYF